MTVVKAAVVTAVFMMIAVPLFAQPVQWTIESGGNGHYYEYVSDPGIDWGHANSFASAHHWEGWTGYLVTFTSAEENAFVVGALSPPDSVWIGARTWPWQWMNGDTWSYLNWCAGEPDESYAGNFSYNGQMMSSGCWRDCTFDTYAHGYIVEYGGYVPVPVDQSTWGRIKSLFE
jgi:hypothetical protein